LRCCIGIVGLAVDDPFHGDNPPVDVNCPSLDVNCKGLISTIPETLLATADEVIQ